jgi:hypothetical protein
MISVIANQVERRKEEVVSEPLIQEPEVTREEPTFNIEELIKQSKVRKQRNSRDVLIKKQISRDLLPTPAPV